MGDTPDSVSAQLHRAANNYLSSSGHGERPRSWDTTFGDLLKNVARAESEVAGDPEITKIEGLALLRVTAAYQQIEDATPFIDKILATVRAAFDWQAPQGDGTIDDQGAELARRAVAEVAKYVSTPESEMDDGRARMVHGVLPPEDGRSAGSAAQVGPLHIEALTDGVHVVERHYGQQFTVAFKADGRAAITSWPPTGEPLDLGERAEIELTGGVTLQVLGGSRPELVFMGEDDGVRVMISDSSQPSVSLMRAEEYPIWQNVYGPAERFFKLGERALQFVETTPPHADVAKKAP